jgi:hypothetical protein
LVTRGKFIHKTRLVYFAAAVLIMAITGSTAWYFSRASYHAQIPIVLSIQGTPLIEAIIQNHHYFLEMDLGSKFQVTLNKQFLDQLDKTSQGTLSNRDMSGKSYETPAYALSSIRVGELVFDNVTAKEDSEEFIVNNTFWVDKNKSEDVFKDKTGSIGRALLERKNLLLDFRKSRIFVSNDQSKLKKMGYDLEKFKKVSFDIGRTGAILTFNTELGNIRLSLDTGSTVSFIRNSLVANRETNREKYGLPAVTCRRFEIGGHNFGDMDLYLQEISSELSELDGILGMDFIKHHVIYLDYTHHMVYLATQDKEQN